MARIAFILLCHKDPRAIAEQVGQLTAVGDYVAVHFDARAPSSDYQELQELLRGNQNVVFARRRAKCGWGEWSLVQATLNTLREAEAAFPRASHFYMLSGDCMPIKAASYVHDYLDAHESDFIESFDFETSNWIKTGLRSERLLYRHYFNERSQKRLFYAALELQKRLGLARRQPADLNVMIGSQWWCLRRETIEALLAFCARRRDVVRFFRTTWIPDETFFQTLVRHLVPAHQIECRTLTFLMFSDYGMPVNFYNDHHDLLVGQDYLFARKISPQARDLKARLGALYTQGPREVQVTREGRRLYQYLTGRGREGRRFAPRFWEADHGLTRNDELLVVICKKWHVAKRLVERVQLGPDVPAIRYLFDEDNTPLPDLGGFESTRDKRRRNWRMLLRMLYETHKTHRMIICMDPGNVGLLQELEAERCSVRLLEIVCSFSDDYLVGHARRVGLASPETTPQTLARILPTIRQDLAYERERIRVSDFSQIERIHQDRTPQENAGPLARFLGIEHEEACALAASDHLFSD